MKKIIVFIDGDCAFCTRFSLLCLKFERDGANFYFSDLNLELSKEFLKKRAYFGGNKSIILYHNEMIYTQFDAIIELANYLKFPLSLFKLFKYTPKIFHNLIYDIFSKNRYLFGKRESCQLLPDMYQKRFITKNITKNITKTQ
ncbi:thiol-disulfide oxidoreductase DCC family protein [Fluviispira vulneris]|uniref:thiol-disulfide oxidoreductase DCC family protein n=1 Tax=Fluviispira vulneris TaxID=2763012 RepID=UPI001644E949|nr:DCC1-like thiol-disulfide oxidoreductase family protein [Fluviispira vulneris]